MTKFIVLLISILSIDFAFPQGDAPTLLRGQGQTTNQVGSFVQVPNNQVTRINSSTGLLETGNSNILANPSFEHSTYSTGWTSSGTGTNAAESSVVVHGLKSFAVTTSSQTINLSQSSTLYQAQFADGVQGLASVRVKTTHTGTCSVCSVQAGTVSTTNCVTVQANNKWGLYKVPFILGATSNGISLACTSGTGLTYVDDAFVGAVDLKADISAAKWLGSVTFGTDCVYASSSGSFIDLTDATCTRAATGGVSIGSGDRLGVSIPAGSPAGNYFVTATFSSYLDVTATGQSGYLELMADSTSLVQNLFRQLTANDAAQNSNLSGNYVISSPLTSAIDFKIRGRISGASAMGVNYLGDSTSRIDVYYYPSNVSVYTSTNADTDWASCGHTTSDFTGFGTVTNIETQCKREGSDLLMRGKFTSGTSTAVEARVNLKLGGTALTSASSSTIPSIQKAGEYLNGATTAPKGGAVLIETSVGYVTFGSAYTYNSTSVNPISKATGDNVANSSAQITLNARIPISGWTNSNIIIGSFNEVMTTPNVSKPKTCYYAFGGASATLASPTECTTGTCTEVVDTCGTVSPPTWSATGVYSDITFPSGTWANNSLVDCKCDAFSTTTANNRDCIFRFITGDNTWASNSSGGFIGNILTYDVSDIAQNSYIKVKCEGQSP